MEKKLFNFVTLSFVTLLLMFTACRKQETPFQYNVDKFYDLEILRYDVPEFDALTLQQKQLVYCLSEAALWGRDILFDQNGRYNLRIRRACEALYLNYPYDTDNEEFAAFERYLKRVWFSNGIHHHYSEDKFLPEFTREWFEQALAEANYSLNKEVLDVMFDPALMQKRMAQADGIDLIASSAGNYYGEGITQAEAEAWYAAHKDNSPEPKWIGLNSQLVKVDGEIEPADGKVGRKTSECLGDGGSAEVELRSGDSGRVVLAVDADYIGVGVKSVNKGAVFVIGVAKFEIVQTGLGIHTCPVIQVPVIDGVSFLNPGDIVASGISGDRKAGHDVPEERCVGTDVPLHVLGADEIVAKLDFPTGVDQTAIVGRIRGLTGRGCEGHVEEELAGLAVEVLYATGETAAESREFKGGIPVGGNLPLEIVVTRRVLDRRITCLGVILFLLIQGHIREI